jgi:hypothetical protein
LLGWFILVATVIPLTDMSIVLRHGGTKAAAFGIHGLTAVLIILAAIPMMIGAP